MYAPDDPTRYQEVLVSPMYLAGSNGTGEAGFAPVAHWPHQYLDEGHCQLLVTSPDQRIRIGWFGDDFELWKISAAEDAFSASRWTATFNHVTPAEMVAGLTAALVQDYDEAIASDTLGRFLTQPTVPWRDTVRPLTDAGWNLDGAAELGTVEIIAPDDQAGILIDRRGYGSDRTTVELWAGPPGWGTRAEATFTARTPSHLIAATAAVMAKSTPVVRERSRATTPLDVRRTAVTQAVHRAARAPRTAADLRVMAAQSRLTGPGQKRTGHPAPATSARLPASSSAPRRGR
ncbi:DUF317 domain-containing protein [Streptomyces sp. NPDC004778]